ncbi:Zinc finger, GRF-type [Sesbania bispinosa]|nr:Zinc finger, GRF-type [Sesbania bispinosa]
MKGNGGFMEKRNSICRSSSSSSSRRHRCCSCGDELALLRSKSIKNSCRMFWRCPNWDIEVTCNYFHWVGDEMLDQSRRFEQSVRIDELQCYVQEIEDLKRKFAKLQKKLSGERTRFKEALCFLMFSMLMTMIVCVMAVMIFEGVRKRM